MGKFVKGQSGNVKGKPPGTKNKLTLIAQSLDGDDVKEVVEVLVAKAKGGDLGAMKILLPRIWPAPRTPPIHFPLPDTSSVEGLSLAVDKIIQGVSEGAISPEQARDLSGLIQARKSVIETLELDRRLSTLEDLVSAGT